MSIVIQDSLVYYATQILGQTNKLIEEIQGKGLGNWMKKRSTNSDSKLSSSEKINMIKKVLNHQKMNSLHGLKKRLPKKEATPKKSEKISIIYLLFIIILLFSQQIKKIKMKR